MTEHKEVLSVVSCLSGLAVEQVWKLQHSNCASVWGFTGWFSGQHILICHFHLVADNDLLIYMNRI